jgi:hypothetical protein
MSAARLHPPALAVRGTLHRIRSFSLGAQRPQGHTRGMRGNLHGSAKRDGDCVASLRARLAINASLRGWCGPAVVTGEGHPSTSFL